MVPLKPNELKRPADRDAESSSSETKQHLGRTTRPTGIWSRDDFDDTVDNRCAFNLEQVGVTQTQCYINKPIQSTNGAPR